MLSLSKPVKQWNKSTCGVVFQSQSNMRYPMRGGLPRGFTCHTRGSATALCPDNHAGHSTHVVVSLAPVAHVQDKVPFVSARKVMMDLGEPYSKEVELCSFHTVSKGSLGECGLRGGYVEATNLHPRTVEEIYKIASINLSPNIMGQVCVHLIAASRSRGQCHCLLCTCIEPSIVQSNKHCCHPGAQT